MNLVFDLDGTLCFDGETISPIIRKALHSAQEAGHEIIFASARSYRDCLPVIEMDFAHNYVIALNGGVVFHQGKVKLAKTIQGEGYQFLIEYCHQYDLPFFVDNTFHYAYHHGYKMPFIDFVDTLQLAQCVPVEELTHPIKMVISIKEHLHHKAYLLEKLSHFSELEIMYHEREHCVYVNPKGVTKASTIVAMFGEDYVCFGNDRNDIEMFRHARYAVQIGDYAPLEPYASVQLCIDDDIDMRIANKIEEIIKE